MNVVDAVSRREMGSSVDLGIKQSYNGFEVHRRARTRTGYTIAQFAS